MGNETRIDFLGHVDQTVWFKLKIWFYLPGYYGISMSATSIGDGKVIFTFENQG